jgi:hypothetical protein
MPFARIAKSWVSENQTIPSGVGAKLVRRDGKPVPKVQALALDTSFAAVNAKASVFGVVTHLRLLIPS